MNKNECSRALHEQRDFARMVGCIRNLGALKHFRVPAFYRRFMPAGDRMGRMAWHISKFHDTMRVNPAPDHRGFVVHQTNSENSKSSISSGSVE